jgi:hypothetical protein
MVDWNWNYPRIDGQGHIFRIINCIKLDDQDLELLNHIELVSFEDDDEPMQVEED